MAKLIQTLISGLSLGSIYALIALGYTMVYGIAKMLNFAHGDIIMVGAYAAITAVAVSRSAIVDFALCIFMWRLVSYEK